MRCCLNCRRGWWATGSTFRGLGVVVWHRVAEGVEAEAAAEEATSHVPTHREAKASQLEEVEEVEAGRVGVDAAMTGRAVEVAPVLSGLDQIGPVAATRVGRIATHRIEQAVALHRVCECYIHPYSLSSSELVV